MTMVLGDMRIESYAATDDHVARLAFVFGHMPHLPPGPPSLGAWAVVPDRRKENGYTLPLAGSRRSR